MLGNPGPFDIQGLQRIGKTPDTPEYGPSNPGRRRFESGRGHHESLAPQAIGGFVIFVFRSAVAHGVTKS